MESSYMNTTRDLQRLSAATALCLVFLSAPLAARADGAKKPAPTNPVWQEECGGCHVAYPPRFLPAESWKSMMGSLDRHFGTDASLDARAAATIEAFLVQNAKRSKTGQKADGSILRITETKWFRSEHDEISAAKWKSPAVGSAANCAACHPNAEKGSFRERDIKVP
ncbi:MAG: cytochrome C [Gammaproteobacteria bacterium]|nr:cytochrome C [Gammaproteobacteria bacterium]